MRPLRSAFVVTLSAFVACTPPRLRRTSPTSPTPEGKPVDRVDYRSAKTLNPSDDEGRTIYARGAQCYVTAPIEGKQQMSWQPPKPMVIDCPPSMDDPAWDWCPSGRIVLISDTSTCVCARDGNPPPPHTAVPCPK